MLTKPKENGCKVCGRDDESLRRGLCQMHYRRFMAKKKSIADEAEAEAFESKCIEEGWIDEKQRGGRPKDEDPFDELLQQVHAEFNRDITAAVNREKAADEKKQALEEAKKAKSASKRNKAN